MHAVWLIIILLISSSKAAKILVISPTSAYSHLLYARTIYKELALRGHEVTAFVPFKIRNETVENLTEMSFSDKRSSRSFKPIIKKHRAYIYLKLLDNLILNCDAIYTNNMMKEILSKPEVKFDLVIIEYNVIGCFSVLKEYFGAPLVGIRSLYLRLEGHDYLGNPTDISYLPLGYFDHAEDFRGKLSDFLFSLFWRAHHYFYTLPRVGKTVEKYFPNIEKSALEMERSVDLVLTNTHHILNGVRPLVPASVDAGFIHIEKEQVPLDSDLENHLNESNGFILFNVGSSLDSDDISVEAKITLTKVFGKLPFKTVMKFDGFENPPKNVRIFKWLPQESVLVHPNIKCFISHGGLLSIQEAIYYKVPLIIIPFVFDQPLNAHRVEKLKIGRRIEIDNFAKPEKLYEIIMDVCTNETYKRNIEEISRVIQDQPMKPLDKAVWWIEYVLRNRGMPHGRSEAVNMSIFNYLLLDVFGFLLLCAFVVFKIFKIAVSYYKAKRLRTKLKLL